MFFHLKCLFQILIFNWVLLILFFTYPFRFKRVRTKAKAKSPRKSTAGVNATKRKYASRKGTPVVRKKASGKLGKFYFISITS